MHQRTFVLGILPVLLTAGLSLALLAAQKPTMPPSTTSAALWERPTDLPDRDLFKGPWSQTHAPDPDAIYTYVRPKEGGTNPGVVVLDPLGREWHVKQPPHTHQGAEGPVEVTLSRVLSAVGYHQPPVYFLSSFLMRDSSGTHREPGGRFRLNEVTMQGRGEWAWQQNPFVGMRPFQGLLVILLMFNSGDLKNSNNTLYEVQGPGNRIEPWYVVRDLGSALGESGGFRPRRNNLDLFEREKFITGVRDGYVTFSYHGKHPELIRDRITLDDARWASTLLSGLSDRQWGDAFRAGGYAADTAERFIRKLRANIAHARQVAADQSGPTERR